jgi:hypothetical protein
VSIFGWIAVGQSTASRAVRELCEVVGVNRRYWTVVGVVAYLLIAIWLESRRQRRLQERQRWIDAASEEVDDGD